MNDEYIRDVLFKSFNEIKQLSVLFKGPVIKMINQRYYLILSLYYFLQLHVIIYSSSSYIWMDAEIFSTTMVFKLFAGVDP